jgi:SAM-dependent methyltransferase
VALGSRWELEGFTASMCVRASWDSPCRPTVSKAFDVVTAGYDRIGDTYRDWSCDNPVRLHWVKWLVDSLPSGKLVVDLGCGPGEPASRMLAERHRVIGVDGSTVQLALARRAAPSVILVRADMTRFALRENSVDVVVSFYALGHIPAERHAPLLESIANWLRPGGLLLTSAPLVAGDETQDDWLGVPMFFGGIGEKATRKAVEQCGLTVDRLTVMDEDEGDGHIVQFVWLVAAKPEASDPARAD